MTHIDESLAKGLASRFLTECDESVNQFMDRLARTNRQTSTKKGWLSKSTQVEKELRSAAFSTHWVGSNSKPALGFIGIGPEKQKFNTWEEKCLTGWCLIDQYETNTFGPDPIPFVISHHALARIFQRATVLRDSVEDWKFSRVLKLLSPLPFWAAFWSSCVFGERGKRAAKSQQNGWKFRFRPVIPSEYGLFLCECSSDDPRIELRTFVNNAQLRDEQVRLKKILDAVARDFEDFPIALHPWSFVHSVYRTDILVLLMRERLFVEKHFLREFLCEDITREDKDGLDDLGFFDRTLPQNVNPFQIDPTQFIVEVQRQEKLKRQSV